MIDFRAIPKHWFFDRMAVQNLTDRTTRRALSRFGAYVRTNAQRSMRRRKNFDNASAPGSPPYAHQGDLRRHIYFSFDPGAQSVVIGPLAYGKERRIKPTGGTQTVPELHEYGGTAVQKVKGGGHRLLRYPARPFMRPAFEAEQSNLPRIWAQAAA